jgi:hypothetical protein
MSVKGGPNTVTSGLVLELDAGNIKSYQSGSTTWFDKSGFANNGTLINEVGYTSSFNGSLVFDGVDDYVNLGNNPSLQFGTGSFTLNVWINPANTSSVNAILAKRQTVNPFNMVQIRVGTFSVFGSGFTISPSKKVSFALWSGPSNFSPSGGFVAVTTDDIIDGNWKNITLTRTSGSIVMYVNAVSQSVSIVYDFGTRTLANISVTGSNWAVGAVPEVPTGFISASYSTVQMYNRALSSQEVLQNYNATKTRFGL